MGCRFNSPIGEKENGELAVLLNESLGLADERDSVGMITSAYEDEEVYGTPTISGITGTYPYPKLRSVGRWISYTPKISAGGTVLTTEGDGQFTGRYIILGDTCFFSAAYFFGSSTSFGATGNLFFNAPMQSRADGIGSSRFGILGHAYCYDAAPARATFGLLGTDCAAFPYAIKAVRIDGTPVAESFPWGWANGDKLAIAGSYRCSNLYQGS